MGNNRYQGGDGSLQVAIALGTSTVNTQTKIVGSISKNCRVTGIRFYGQAAVTATSLVAEVFARTAAGATGVSLQSATKSIKFADAAAGKTGVAASLTTTGADQYVNEDQLIEVVVTADTCSAGPGDLLVEVEYEPR